MKKFKKTILALILGLILGFTIIISNGIKAKADTITDLTGYTWVCSSKTTIAGNGHFYIDFDIDEFSGYVNEELYLGYSFDPREFEVVPTSNNVLAMPSIVDIQVGYTLIFTGGTDSTNATLIAWLEANGTLTAPAPATYTIIFNANGGTGTLPASVQVDPGDNYTIPGNTTNLTKTNYHFVGWNTDSSATTGLALLSNIQADTILYAIWAIDTYTLILNGNGASFYISSSNTYESAVSLTVESGSVYSDLEWFLSHNVYLSRTGYELIGWGTSSSATTPLTQNEINNIHANTTLYAIWSETVNYYTLYYNSNGADSGTTPSSVTVADGTTITLSGNTGNLVKDGYTFGGWAIGSLSTIPLTTITLNGSGAVVFAIWIRNPVYYTITFSTNGGTGTAPSPVSVLENTDYNVIGNITNLTKSGYSFVGWNTNSSATTGISLLQNVTSNTTLYAIWRVNTALTWNVSYNANGGSGTVPGSFTATNGSIYAFNLEGINLTRSGYNFIGWNTDPNSDTPLTYIMVTSDVVLYAVWEADPDTHVITFNANGGSGSLPDSVSVVDGTTYYVGGNITNLYKTGSVFVGWNTDNTATTGLSSIAVTSNITLYAIWTDELYSINGWYYFNDEVYFPNGGSVLNVVFTNNGSLYYSIVFSSNQNDLYFVDIKNNYLLVYTNGKWVNPIYRQLWFGDVFVNYSTYGLLGNNGAYIYNNSTFYTLGDVFVSIADVPVRTISSLLNFEVFGTSLLIALGSLIALLVIIFIVKKLI